MQKRTRTINLMLFDGCGPNSIIDAIQEAMASLEKAGYQVHEVDILGVSGLDCIDIIGFRKSSKGRLIPRATLFDAE